MLENWKIIQDHTKGKKMTHTPAVTLYGDNKEKPYWYEKEEQPTAEGVHTWVSSYADHFGYGFWDPDEYTGASVLPTHGYGGFGQQKFAFDPNDGFNRYNYGIGYRENYNDPKRHEGALAKYVPAGYDKRGYSTSGKWVKGDQITQLNLEKGGVTMRRRTISQGGKLSGMAHNPFKGATEYKAGTKGYGY